MSSKHQNIRTPSNHEELAAKKKVNEIFEKCKKQVLDKYNFFILSTDIKVLFYDSHTSLGFVNGSKRNTIHLNRAILFDEEETYYTTCHELTHLIDQMINGGCRHFKFGRHDANFRAIMNDIFGITGDDAKSIGSKRFDMKEFEKRTSERIGLRKQRKRKTIRRFIYEMDCGCKFVLSTVFHNRIKRGRRYICNCKNLVETSHLKEEKVYN